MAAIFSSQDVLITPKKDKSRDDCLLLLKFSEEDRCDIKVI